MPNTPFQKRARSRAKRLGLDTKYRYTRDEARKLKDRLAAKRTAKGNKLNVSGTLPVEPGKTRSNTVTSGAGAARKGQTFSLQYDAKGKMVGGERRHWVHAYGESGPRKKYIRNSVAKQYGYKQK